MNNNSPSHYSILEPYKFEQSKRGRLINIYPNNDGSWTEVREGPTTIITLSDIKPTNHFSKEICKNNTTKQANDSYDPIESMVIKYQ